MLGVARHRCDDRLNLVVAAPSLWTTSRSVPQSPWETRHSRITPSSSCGGSGEAEGDPHARNARANVADRMAAWCLRWGSKEPLSLRSAAPAPDASVSGGAAYPGGVSPDGPAPVSSRMRRGG